MVFQSRKRRVPAKSQTVAKPTIKEFPEELLLAILERTTGISEVLKLRETSKFFGSACVSTIRTRLKTLYVHPAPSSVKRAKKICKSYLSSEIEEICFVNKIHWSLIRIPFHEVDKGFAHTWTSHHAHEKKKGLHFEFAAHYNDLFNALASLPKFKTVSFKDKCDEAGFNMVSEHTIYHWAFTIKDRANITKERRAENKLYGPVAKPTSKPTMAYNFSDIDVIVAAMNRLKFTTLKLRDEIPFADASALVNTSFGNLTRVELHMHLGWNTGPCQRFCHEILRSAAASLQDLRLTFQHNPAAIRRLRPEISFATVVKDLDFPKLQYLELLALDLPENLPYIPQIIDFKYFLSTSCKRLEHFRTIRVFPTFLHLLIMPGHTKSMDEILKGFDGEAKMLEEEDENTRAWEISV